MTDSFSNPRLIRVGEVCERTGLHRSTIYRLRKDGRFPSAVRVGDRLIAWREQDIAAWIAGLRDVERDNTAA